MSFFVNKNDNDSVCDFDASIKYSFNRDLLDLIANYVIHKNLSMDDVKSVLVQKVNTIDLASTIVDFMNRRSI